MVCRRGHGSDRIWKWVRGTGRGEMGLYACQCGWDLSENNRLANVRMHSFMRMHGEKKKNKEKEKKKQKHKHKQKTNKN